MLFRSLHSRLKGLRMKQIVVTILAGTAALGVFVHAQPSSGWIAPKVAIPAESVGIEGVVRTLVSAFDHADVLALGEAHGHFRQEGDLRVALIRDPGFAAKVRTVVVEFANSAQQTTLDRYIRGESVSPAELALVWKTTTQAANGNDIWENPIYPSFFAAVRDVNQKLPVDRQIRVEGADPGQGSTLNRDAAAASMIGEALKKHEKVLVIFGTAHFYRTMDTNYLAATGDGSDIVKMLESRHPGRTFVAIPIGRLDKPRPVAADMAPGYQKFDDALKTQVRPVMVPAQASPFRDLSVEEFLGRSVTTCRGPNGCVSAFKGTTLTLGQMADALIYFGGSEGAVAQSGAIPSGATALAFQRASTKAHLTHRYSFTSDPGDSVGNAPGKLEGAAEVKGGKLVLDGSTGTFLDLPGGLLSGYKATTIEFWISTGPNGNYARVFDAGEISGHAGIKSIYFCVDHTSTGDWRLKISVPDGKDQVVAIKGNLSDREDLHVVNVLDPATGFMGIYVNGELAGSRTDLISLEGVSPHYFFVGRSLYSSDAYLNASIDEFRIYDSALSPEQVKSDYSAGPDRIP